MLLDTGFQVCHFFWLEGIKQILYLWQNSNVLRQSFIQHIDLTLKLMRLMTLK